MAKYVVGYVTEPKDGKNLQALTAQDRDARGEKPRHAIELDGRIEIVALCNKNLELQYPILDLTWDEALKLGAPDKPCPSCRDLAH